MPAFRKKPVIIEAWKWPMEPLFAFDSPPFAGAPDWLREALNRTASETGSVYLDRTGQWRIATLESALNTPEAAHVIDPGDWIIQGVQGELYPCKPDIFAATYEPAA